MNFALILFVLVLATGVVWCFDHFWARKKRPVGAKDPWWVEYGGSFFPVILAVFLLRSFLVEPFKIPSGSMIPTLLVGDFILVNKYTYGIRLPVINQKILELNTPQRGDVVVFRYPPDPTLDYIKRVVGVAGDTVEYRNKKLTVNGKEVVQKKLDDYLDRDRLYYTPRFDETLGAVQHQILVEPDAPGFVPQTVRFPNSDKCHYNSEGLKCEVPTGHYFVMGDNRDNSQDSRFWGFVPDENLVGKAFFVWFNFGDLKRIGSFR
ncbi:MAG TPA: signal peptidase I [Rhodocyclaceae bacterium]|nr:signal peptidase I [Rhodocyclaceae bacterium]